MQTDVQPALADWPAFAEAASGEWDGVTATFQAEGAPRQLPEYYVPQAYRDWGVELYDWQSQCSMLASDTGLAYSLRRLMPTVGCEADAIAFTEDQQEAFGRESSDALVTTDGGYTVAPVGLKDTGVHTASIEHCFPMISPGQRTRVVHRLKRMGREQSWTLSDVEIHRERRDGPYNGRRELAGCGGGMPAFAMTAALDVAGLNGEWHARGVRLLRRDDGSMERIGVEITEWKLPLVDAIVVFPLGVWMAAAVTECGGEFMAGVVMEGDASRARVSRQRIENGVLREAELLALVRKE
jgi:hypothetical protein